MLKPLSILTATMALATSSPIIAASRDRNVDKTTISGRRTMLGVYYALDSSCKPLDWVEVKVIVEPKHGKVDIENRRAVAAYAPSSPRKTCNGRSIEAKSANYTSSNDYKGSDDVSIEMINSKGNALRIRYHIAVR